mgnify:CR=1 FL=1
MIELKDRSMSMTRTFDAPVELVWKVLTTPEYISVWWGPEGFTNTIRTMDVEEGGIFDFTMHAPDGTDFVNYYHYTEVKPLKKLVMSHREHPKFNIEVELFPEGEKTKVTWTNVFDSAPTMQETIRAFKADVGLIENIERLSNFVKKVALASR